MRQTKRYTFYESYYGNIYSISQDLKKADIEYFFSSDRKGYNYYGVIVRIFKNRNEEEWESQNVVFEDENLAVIRNHYKEETKTNFFDHIKYLRKEDYILKQSNPKYGYWTDSDWGTYEYTASELKIYFKSNIETIGEIDGKDYSQVFKEQFEVLHSKYINDLPLVTFCAKQHIPMEHELLISWLFGNGFPPVLEWGTPYSPKITIFDISHFCEGADVIKMLKDIPMHTLFQSDNLTVYRVKDARAGSDCKILKVENFKNTGLDSWFVFESKEEKFSAAFLVDYFGKEGISFE